MNAALSRPQQFAKLREMIQDIDFTMLTTVEADGTLRSRPLSTQEASVDGELWFFTEADSAKVEEVQHERHVNLSYAAPQKSRYVSVSGTARVLRDPAKARELWKPVLRAFFPKGLDDPNLALLKVTVQQAEYWDDTSSTMVQLFKMVRAAVSGEPYEAENRKLNF